MSVKPDLVECWVFRVVEDAVEILLIRRAAHRIFPGLWQCVTGGVEGNSPCSRWRSVPQMPQASTRTSKSSGPGAGFSTSRMNRLPMDSSRTAFIKPFLPDDSCGQYLHKVGGMSLAAQPKRLRTSAA